MNYLEALKIYNKGQNSWCSPRKGTPEYYMVKSIMNKNSGNSLNSIESMKKLSQVMSKNSAIVKSPSTSTSSSSSIKLTKKRILPIKKEKRFPNRTSSTSSSSSIKLPKKRILPIKKEKRFPNRTSSTSSSSS
jgi:hypothetical protein